MKAVTSRMAEYLGVDEETGTASPESPPPAPVRKSKVKKAKAPATVYPADFDGFEPPKMLWRARRIGNLEYEQRNNKPPVKGMLHLPGRGSKEAKVMFVSPCVLQEENWTTYSSEPILLKGAPGNLFFRCIRRVGFKDEDWFYTTVCKYFVPRLKPTAQDIRWNQAMLDDEIETIKPKIIVCLGKLPFDHLFKLKFKLKDIQGGFFYSEKYDCLLYPMDTIITPLLKPEHMERFLVDLKEVKRTLDELSGLKIDRPELNYQVVENAEQLRQLMSVLSQAQSAEALPWLSVDCEWAGQTAWGGLLRSCQLGWGAGWAAYIKLRDENKNYVFDVPINEVGDILRPVLSYPGTKLVGHNFAADGVWLEEHFNISTYQRCGFDTMFAQQTINEYADLKLERMAVKYTKLGRYDIPLTIWKKENKFDEDDNDGYGTVPDSIIIDYALRDVDATIRIMPILMLQLTREGLRQYYFDTVLPFVTDVFIELMRTGLPINREYLDEMRSAFTLNQEILVTEFRKAIKAEANRLLVQALCGVDKQTGAVVFKEMLSRRHPAEFLILFKQFVGAEKFDELLPLFDHWCDADHFNVNSTDHLRRWLFDVKKFPPLKTTKKDGVTMAWERVLTLPPDKQAEYTPAADKQTIKVLSGKDKLVAQLEELKMVMNIVKAFLKAKDDQGREQGLHKWIQQDDRVHANFSITETGRPRAWRPNIFNWPKAIAKPIERAFERINVILAEERAMDIAAGNGEEAKVEFASAMKRPVSLRSAVQAPEGWCFVDMDYQTAEIMALAYVSGDENMINVLREPDVQFARVDKSDPKKAVRICYNENEGIPEEEQDPKLLVALSDPRIIRDDSGNIMHPQRDLHWELGCSVFGYPREKLVKEVARGVGKVGNFSTPYGSAATNLERLVEASTGKKPPEGTGDKMINSYKTRYPTASRFLDAMALVPSQGDGTYRSVSGRVRHFYFNNLEDVEGLTDYARNGILSPLTRQARNFPIQELVAATLAKALKQFVAVRNAARKQSGLMMALYDAAVVLCPLEELAWAMATLRDCMTKCVPWTINGRTFCFEVETSVAFKWGVELTDEEKKIIKPYLEK